MRKQTQQTKASLNLSDTSAFSLDQQPSGQQKKRIVLSSRRENTFRKSLLPADNKENVQHNIITISSISKSKQKQKQKNCQSQHLINRSRKQNINLSNQNTKQKHLVSQSHFYLQSSCDDYVNHPSHKSGLSIKSLAMKFMIQSQNYLKGIQTLRRMVLRVPWKNLNNIAHQRKVAPRLPISYQRLNNLSKVLQKWAQKVFIDNIRMYNQSISKKQIHLAVQVLKKRDIQLSMISKNLSIMKLMFFLQKWEQRHYRYFFSIQHKRSCQLSNVLHHQKLYSFSNTPY